MGAFVGAKRGSVHSVVIGGVGLGVISVVNSAVFKSYYKLVEDEKQMPVLLDRR